MYVNPFQVSLETLIGAGPILGHRLEDRGSIRKAQDRALLHYFQDASTVPLRQNTQQELFCVAPFDLLVSETARGKQFHLLEINGTGIGGLTNMTGEAVSPVLECLSQWAQQLPEPDAMVLVASSGKEAEDSPRLNKLIHEKILYAEALKRGFEYSGREPRVLALHQLLQDPLPQGGEGGVRRPVIVLGYIKDFLDELRLESDGRLFLAGRQVHAAINDRFCLNVLHHFQHQVDLRQFRTMNRCFLAGADKGVAYALLNEFLEGQPMPAMARVDYARVHQRAELIETVLAWVRQGRPTVIKPQGTGLGHGIEFFLDPSETTSQILEKIDRSLRLTEQYYQANGGAFPYTVCDYVDSCTIARPGHPLFGHKYELRVIVYRDGMDLKAFPSIIKISSQRFDPRQPSHLSLINNITASAEAKKASGCEFMQPLCNRDTLDLLNLQPEELRDVCAFSTSFVRHILDKVQDAPHYFGLPASVPAVTPEITAIPTKVLCLEG